MPRVPSSRTTAPAAAGSGEAPPLQRHGSGGLVLAPFRGVRYQPGRVRDLGAVTSPPYDVVDAGAVAALESADPHNVVRLILPRKEGCGPEGRYAHAAATLRSWLADGVLVPDAKPGLYVYEQTGAGVHQRGLLGGVELRAPEDRVVLPHEDTMPGPVTDRLELMRATQANLEPIFLVYDGGGDASALVDEVARLRPPLLEATTSDAVTHRLWQVSDPAELRRVDADLLHRHAVIADGHHRYAAYWRLQQERHAAGDGSGPWDYGLALLVDSAVYPPQLRSVHRVVPHLPAERAAVEAARGFAVREVVGGLAEGQRMLTDAGERGPAFLLAGEGRCWLLAEPDATLLQRTLPPQRSARWRAQDAAVLHETLLPALWGGSADQLDVTYHHTADSAVRAAKHGGGCAVLLNPATVADVLEVSGHGERMPRKSTSFGPKPRTGFVLRTLSPPGSPPGSPHESPHDS